MIKGGIIMSKKKKLSKLEKELWKLAEKQIYDYIDPDWEIIYIMGEPTKYMVSNVDDVMNTNTCRLLKQRTTDFGYLSVNLNYNKKSYTCKVHRLVAESFIPNPENKREVNHIDADKKNNWVGNLEWVTSSENKKHAWRLGLYENARMAATGVNSPSAIYTEEQVHSVCKLLEQGLEPTEISKILNVNRQLPSAIKHYGKWRHISSQYNIPEPIKRKMKEISKYKEIIDEEIINVIKNSEYNADMILEKIMLPNSRTNRKYITSRKTYLSKNI